MGSNDKLKSEDAFKAMFAEDKEPLFLYKLVLNEESTSQYLRGVDKEPNSWTMEPPESAVIVKKASDITKTGVLYALEYAVENMKVYELMHVLHRELPYNYVSVICRSYPLLYEMFMNYLAGKGSVNR